MNYRIILLHDNSRDYSSLLMQLSSEGSHRYLLSFCDVDKEDYSSYVFSQRYDICLLDEKHIHAIPENTLFKIAESLPIILLSHQQQKSFTPEYFSDVILESTLSTELMDRSVRYIFEQKNYRRQLKALTLYDTLTQLPNRNHFQHRLTATIAQHARSKKSFSLLLIDLDRFKLINDSFGNETGDQFLIHTSKILKKNLRHNDMAARLGNDEFAVILDTDNVHPMADRLMRELSETLQYNDHEIRIHASIGIAKFPQDGKRHHELIKSADNAMQDAKKRGGGNFRFFDANKKNTIYEHSWIESEFYQALNKGQLFLEYQPLVTASTLDCKKLEALCRWNHPKKGLIPPDTFIPIIEKTPMIIDLGRWVLESVCKELSSLQNDDNNLKIAVNISMMQICHTNFIDDIKQILAATGANADKLELELTESALMIDPLQSISTLTSLRDLGIHIAIDDFGTGHSSLAYLVDLPIDVLKIDRSFIFEFTQSKKRESVIKAIIALARSLNLTTVAEGVEDAHTAEYLLSLGCDLLQGYHISRPMTLDKVIEQWSPLQLTTEQSS
ncbi:MAG: putative bifunctional diguanylate cyclase/phosphodiesterase [Cellvibrionaceae bacterium]